MDPSHPNDIIYVESSKFPRLYGYAPRGDSGKSIFALGIVQMVLGLMCFIFAIDALITQASYGFTGYGFWCAVTYIISGSLATALGNTPYRYLVRASLATAVVAVIFGVIQVAIGAAAVYVNVTGNGCTQCSASAPYTYCSQWTGAASTCLDSTGYQAALLADSALLGLGLTEICLALATVFITCGCGDYALGHQRIEVVPSEVTDRKSHAGPYYIASSVTGPNDVTHRPAASAATYAERYNEMAKTDADKATWKPGYGNV